jgi:hypothetical protein
MTEGPTGRQVAGFGWMILVVPGHDRVFRAIQAVLGREATSR